jgi:hypothetical protein
VILILVVRKDGSIKVCLLPAYEILFTYIEKGTQYDLRQPTTQIIYPGMVCWNPPNPFGIQSWECCGTPNWKCPFSSGRNTRKSNYPISQSAANSVKYFLFPISAVNICADDPECDCCMNGRESRIFKWKFKKGRKVAKWGGSWEDFWKKKERGLVSLKKWK